MGIPLIGSTPTQTGFVLPENENRDYLVKPEGALVVNRVNPFGANVIACWADGSYKDLTGRYDSYLTQVNPANSIRQKERGIYLYGDHAGNVDDRWSTTEPLRTLKSYVGGKTLLFVHEPEWPGANQTYLFDGLRSLGFNFMATGNADEIVSGYNGANGYANTRKYPRVAGFNLNRKNVCAISIHSVTKRVVLNLEGYTWEDGTGEYGIPSYIGQGTLTVDDHLEIASYSFSNYYHYRGTVHLMSVIEGFYEQPELDALCANPYQIIKQAGTL